MKKSGNYLSKLNLIILLVSSSLALISCGGDSGNDASNEIINGNSYPQYSTQSSSSYSSSSYSNGQFNYSGLTYQTYEGLTAEQPCGLALNKTIAHVSSTNQDYLCNQDVSTGIWSWIPYQSESGVVVGENGRVYETFVDTRDGQIYKMVTIGTQTWMAENLNYATVSSHCMIDMGVEYCGYGRYYRWSDAIDTAGHFSTDGIGCGVGSYAKDCAALLYNNTIRGICPQGWHLPDTSEWRTLFNYVGTPSVLLKQGLSSSYLDKGTDVYGFSAFPMGYWYQGDCQNCSRDFGGSILVTSVQYHAATPIYFYDNVSLDNIPDVDWDEENFNIGWSSYFTKTGLLPIRCVKNEDVNSHSLPTQSSDVYY